MGSSRKIQDEMDRVLKKVHEGVEMGSSRKIQDEMDRVLKQVHEDVDVVDSINQKEVDIKKEIKKLQRYRVLVEKTFIKSSMIKDKKVSAFYEQALLGARKIIEREMERFKVCEKETKAKVFSTEGVMPSNQNRPFQLYPQAVMFNPYNQPMPMIQPTSFPQSQLAQIPGNPSQSPYSAHPCPNPQWGNQQMGFMTSSGVASQNAQNVYNPNPVAPNTSQEISQAPDVFSLGYITIRELKMRLKGLVDEAVMDTLIEKMSCQGCVLYGTFIMAMILNGGILSFADTRGSFSVLYHGRELVFKCYEAQPGFYPFRRERIFQKLLTAGPQVSMAICGSASWGYELCRLVEIGLRPHNVRSSFVRIYKVLQQSMIALHTPTPIDAAAIVTFYTYLSGVPYPSILLCERNNLSIGIKRDYVCDGTAYGDVNVLLGNNYTPNLSLTDGENRGHTYVRVSAGRADNDRLDRGYGDDAHVGGYADALTQTPDTTAGLVGNTVFRHLGKIEEIYPATPRTSLAL